jgi:hypothetical protein
MEKMTAIIFAKTGHLLGVVTRASQPDVGATVAQIAAGGFRLRGSDDNSSITLDIPESAISVALVDYDTRILYRPHLFAMEDGKPEQKTEDASLAITLDGSQITATLPDAVSDAVNVWCQISGGGLTEPIIRSVTIPGSVATPIDTGTEALVLAAGEYRVAMFAPDYALAVFTQTFP